MIEFFEFKDLKFFEVKMRCTKCGLCCIKTEMELLPEDIERLVSLGYKLEDIAYYDGIYWRLKNINDHCVFYDVEKRECKIYDYRPIGCRLYPLQFDGEKVIIDKSCPEWRSISRSEVKRLEKYVIMFIEKAKLTNTWLNLCFREGRVKVIK